MKALKIIGVASGYGARDKGCGDGPAAIKEYLLAHHQSKSSQIEILYPNITTADVYSAIAELCRRVATLTYTFTINKTPFAVVGGDHSCAIGTWSGVAQALRNKGPAGLIWIDAHMDSHVPESSPSGAIHGMPLAVLLGFGDPRLTQLIEPAYKFLPEHVCLIGIRSYEQGEAELLRSLGVRIFYMEEIYRRGFDQVFTEALQIAKTGTAGYGVTIDLDAIDPNDAPGVGTPAAGGIRAKELLAAIDQIKQDPELVALEIAELNPQRDFQQQTLRLAVEFLRRFNE